MVSKGDRRAAAAVVAFLGAIGVVVIAITYPDVAEVMATAIPLLTGVELPPSIELLPDLAPLIPEDGVLRHLAIAGYAFVAAVGLAKMKEKAASRLSE